MQKKIWKQIFICFCLLSLGGGIYHLIEKKTGNIQPHQWNTYSSEEAKFNIQFPSKPEQTQEHLSIANTEIDYHELRSQHQSALYAVSYIDFPSHWKWLGTNKLLTKSFQMFIENEEGIEKVLSQQITSHQGHSALAYRLEQNGKEIWGKFIVVGNTLYRVTVTYPLTFAEKFDPEAFINTFQVKG